MILNLYISHIVGFRSCIGFDKWLGFRVASEPAAACPGDEVLKFINSSPDFLSSKCKETIQFQLTQ